MTTLLAELQQAAKSISRPKISPPRTLDAIIFDTQLIMNARLQGLSPYQIEQLHGISAYQAEQIATSDLFLAELANHLIEQSAQKDVRFRRDDSVTG